jgi:hypothetical protein
MLQSRGTYCFGVVLMVLIPSSSNAQVRVASYPGSEVYPGLPPPPATYSHRMLPKLERPPLQFSVRPRRQFGAAGSERLRGSTRLTDIPKKAPALDRAVNPLPLLLSDVTLRPGDVVMFPDGPRIFRGSVGGSHSVGDFHRIVANAERLSKTARAALDRLKAGLNRAWAGVALRPDGTLREKQPSNPYAEAATAAATSGEETHVDKRAQAPALQAE